MIKKKITKKLQLFITIFICVFIFSGTLLTKTVHANQFLGCYVDRNFTSMSQAELIEIYPRSTYFTLHVDEGEGAEDEDLMVHIVDIDNEISAYDLPLDGTVTLYDFVLPAGEYRIWFTGS